MAQNLALMGIKGTEDWYFGQILRDQANEILLKGTVGMYLVRGSSEPGNFALSVRDNNKASHYKIIASKRQNQEGYKFKIGQQVFISIHHIIEYYKKNKLSDSTLTTPAPRLVYRAKFDFKPDTTDGDSSDDIGLRRNDCVLFLEVMIRSDGTENSSWWRVLKRNTGEIGYVPANYLRQSNPDERDDCRFGALRQLTVPFDVEVMRLRNPNIFDASQLRLEVGDLIQVKYVLHDQPELWYGLNNRSKLEGIFPFNYVRPLILDGGEACRYSGVSCNSAASSRGGVGGGSAGGCGSGSRASQLSGSCTLDEQVEDAA